MDEGGDTSLPARPLRLDGWRDWGMGLLAALLTLAVAAWVLRVWEASAGVPWFWFGDNKSFLLMFQNIQTTGWWTTSEVIGGGDTSIAFFPLGGGALAQVLGVRLLGLVVHDPITLYNTYFLLSVPGAAIAGYYAFRRLAMRPAFALTISALYALLPYHFNRGHRGHIFLAAYAAVPLAAMLIVRHASGEAVLVKGSATAVVDRDRRAHLVEAVLIALFIGASTMYYALMFSLLLLLVALLVSIRARSDVVFTSAFRTALLTATALVAGLLPTLISWASNGLPSTVSRSYASSEIFSFKVISALLPVEDHRLPPFAYLREQISGSPVPGEGPESLGLVGVFGAGLLAWWVLRQTLGARRSMATDLGPLAACGMIGVLLATTGGFGALLSVVGISFLRSWARMGIFIAFFALTALGLWLQARASARQWSHFRQPLVLGSLLIIGVLDQTTPAMAPDHDLLHATHRRDLQYAHSIEEAVGPGARVLQLPYMTFPENREPVGVPSYDPLRWPLTGTTLRWSFGAPADGRADWQRTVSRIDARGMVMAAAVTGHDAIMIDRHGYEDGAGALLDDLGALVGPPLLSAFDRFATFSLDSAPTVPGVDPEELADLVRNATVVVPGEGFADTTDTAGQPLVADGDLAYLEVDPGPDLRDQLRVTVRPLAGTFRLSATSATDRQVLRIAGATTFEVDLPRDARTPFVLEFEGEPLSGYAGATARWELVDVDLPLDDALEDALSPG